LLNIRNYIPHSKNNELEIKRKVTIKQYAPETFRKIRKLFEITDKDLIEALEPALNMKNIQSSGEGAGASGSFFFFCMNCKFTIKTISSTEIGHMLRMMPDYLEYLEKHFIGTRLALILGIFSFKID